MVTARSSTSALLLVCLGAGCGSGDGNGARGAPSVAPASTSYSAREAWRIEVPGASASPVAIALAGGAALVAWEVEAETAFPGQDPVAFMGETDVVVTRIGPGGAVEAVHSISSSGTEEIVAMVAGEPAALIMEGTAPMTVAGTALSPPPPAPDQLLPPTWAALITLDARGAPTAAVALDAAADSWRAVRLGADWIVASNHDRDDVSRSVVQRLAGRGAAWSRELAGVEVSELALLGDTILALTRGETLGFTRLRPDTGEVITSQTIERIGGAFSGDLGDLVGAVRLGDTDIVFGYSGREAAQVKGETLSHSIEPLVLVIGPGGKARRSQLVDVTGTVAAVGLLFDQPAALIDVIHNTALYSGLAAPHRGTYVTLGGHQGPPSLVPLEQYRYPNDDWENQPAEMVTGTDQMTTSAGLLHGDRVWRIGRAENNQAARVIHYQLAPAK
jgi:hypothetical protein